MDNDEMIEVIDGFLLELGTSSIVDARIARDQLMDLRLMAMLEILEAEANVPVPQ